MKVFALLFEKSSKSRPRSPQRAEYPFIQITSNSPSRAVCATDPKNKKRTRVLGSAKRKAQRARQGFVGVIRLIRVPAVLPLCVCCGVGAADSVIIIPQSSRFVNIQNRRFFVEIFVKNDTQ